MHALVATYRMKYFRALVILPLLFPAFVGLEMKKEDRLCVDAIDQILPSSELPQTTAGMEHVVQALVQIDSTLGITPCQLRKGLSDAGDLMDDQAPGQSSQAYVNPAAARLQAMKDASGESQYGGPRKSESAAHRAGATAGNGLKYGWNKGIEGIKTGFEIMGDGLEYAFHNPDEIAAEAINGLTSGINSLNLFPDIHVDVDGKWVYSSGEKMYDALAEGSFAVFDFFSGVAGAIAPSAQGRRRVVYDKDCDFILDKVDIIENTCAAYRYARLQQLKPAIEGSGKVNDQIMLNMSALNATWSGEDLSFKLGLRETFSKQKEALYGVNGDCLNPTKGSLAYMSTELSNALSEQFDNLKGEFDSVWTNLLRIDNYTSVAGPEETSAIPEGIGAVLNLSVLNQKDYNLYHLMNMRRMAATGNFNLTSVANHSNSAEAKLQKNLDTATTNDASLKTLYSSQVGRSLKILDSLTSKLDGSPAGLNRFSDDLTRGVGRLLSNAVANLQSYSSDQIKSGVFDPAEKDIKIFESLSDSERTANEQDWMNEAKSFTISEGAQLSGRQLKTNSAAQNMSLLLSDAQQSVMGGVDSMAAKQSMMFSNAQSSSQDAASTARELTVRERSSSNMIKQLFVALKEGNQNAVQEMLAKANEIIKMAAGSSSDSLTFLDQNAASLAAILQQDTDELGAKLTSEAQKILHSVSQAMLLAQERASAQRQAMDASNQMSQSQTQGLSDSNDLAIRQAADQWMGSGDAISDSLLAAASSSSSQISQFNRDASGAVSSVSSSLDQAQEEAQIQAIGASSGIIQNLAQAGSSAASVTGAAGSALTSTDRYMRNIFGNADAAGDAVNSASRQSASQSAGLANQVGSADDETVASYDRSYRAQLSQAGDQVDQSLASSGGYMSRKVSELSNQAHQASQQVDTAASTVETSVSAGLSSNEKNQDELSSIGDELDAVVHSNDAKLGNYENANQDKLNSAGSSASSLARTVVADVSGKASSIAGSADSQADIALSQSRRVLDSQSTRVKTQLDKARDSKFASDKEILDAQIRAHAASGNIGQVIADAIVFVQKMAKDAQDGLDLPSDASDIDRRLMGVNLSFSANLSSVNSSLSAWNKSVNDQLSAGVKQVVDELQAREFAIERAAQYVSSGVLNNGTYGKESVADLEAAGFTSSGFMDSLQSQKNGLDSAKKATDARFSLFEGDMGKAKQVVKNNAYQASAYSAFIRGVLDKQADEAEKLTKSVQQAVSYSNSSLGLSANKSLADSQFRTDLYKGQSQGMLVAGSNAASGSSSLVSHASAAIGASLSESSANLQGMESSFAAHGHAMQDKFNRAMRSLASSHSQFSGNVSADRSQQQVQLMMAKRAVRDLLSGWLRYVEIETGKFKKMNDSDTQYTSSMERRIDTTNETSGASLRASESTLSGISAQVLEAAADYVDFSGQVENGISGFKSGLELLNTTASAGVKQMKEMIYNLDANDEFTDKTERSSMANTVKQFEQQLDQQARLAEQSVASF